MKTDTRERIVKFIQRKHHVRPYDLQQFLGFSPVAVHRQLKRLVTDGMITRSGRPPHVLYSSPESPNRKNYTSKSLDTRKIQQIASPIFQKYNVKKASVFGSRARGDARPGSDVDILVELPKKTSFFDFVNLKLDLEDCFHKPIDLVEYDAIKSRLKSYILNDETIIYKM